MLAQGEILDGFQLCEAFASAYSLTTDYVWQEFADPQVYTTEQVKGILDYFTVQLGT